mgnify:FL=1
MPKKAWTDDKPWAVINDGAEEARKQRERDKQGIPNRDREVSSSSLIDFVLKVASFLRGKK